MAFLPGRNGELFCLFIYYHVPLDTTSCWLLTIFRFQVDYDDFDTVEWKSPAIFAKSQRGIVAITGEWKDTISEARDALRVWGERSVVPVDSSAVSEEEEDEEDEENVCSDAPTPPPNSPVGVFISQTLPKSHFSDIFFCYEPKNK